MVEIVVIIAIMIVLLAILTPSLLRYTETSRMQKDESAMDELCGTVQLALADAETFDEACLYAIPNNYVTYTDSSGVYGAMYIDEEFWAPDGSGNAVTITFNPDENGNYTIADGLVNDMTYGNGSVADSRTADNLKQCYFSEMGDGKLYHQVEKTFGATFNEKSATYKNSSYTVFVKLELVNGIKRANVYGLWNGTNLDENCPASLGSGTSSYIEEEPEQTKSGGTTQSNFTSSDLQGSGGGSSSGGPAPSYKKAPCGIEGHNLGDGKNHNILDCGHFGCQCSGEKIPEGGVYYVGVTVNETIAINKEYTDYVAKYGAGDCFPAEVLTGDIFRYGDYEYRYNQRNTHPTNGYQCTWATKTEQQGWGVRTLKQDKKQYGEILRIVNDCPITCVSNTFYKCASMITAPTIPNTVIDMYQAFNGCSKITTTPVIPDSVENMAHAFSSCKALTTVTNIPRSVTTMYHTFYYCSALTTVPDFEFATGLVEYNCLTETFNNCALTSLPKLPNSPIKLESTFCNNKLLVDISDFIVPSDCKNLYGTFSGCTALDDDLLPTIPNTVTSMDRTFTRCTSLVDVGDFIIPNSVTYIGGLFSYCTALEIAPQTIPTSVTSMWNTFNGCTSLTTPPVFSHGVRDMGNTFQDCTSLQTAPIIPKGVSFMKYTFYRCTSLTGVVEINSSIGSSNANNCFGGVDFAAQNLTLTGTSTKLDENGAFGINYCVDCNGKCQDNH